MASEAIVIQRLVVDVYADTQAGPEALLQAIVAQLKDEMLPALTPLSGVQMLFCQQLLY